MTISAKRQGTFYVLDGKKLTHEPNPALIGNMIYNALTHCPNGTVGRMDSAGRTTYGLHEATKRMRADAITKLFADQATRADAFSPAFGVHGPEDLIYKFNEVLEAATPPLNAKDVWPTDTQVPPGALKYRQSRVHGTGEAYVYTGGFGDDVTSVGIGRAFQDSGVIYVVSKATIDMMEQMRAGLAGFDTQDKKMRQARYVIERLKNKWTWEGSQENDLWGLLNHPWIDTVQSGVKYNNSTSPNDQIEDLGTWANYCELESESAFVSDTCLISTKLHVYLSNRPRSDGSDKSVWAWFMEANDHIKTVKRIRELNDVKGKGVHGMTFTRGGTGLADASATIVEPMSLTLLPPDVRTLGTEFMLLGSCGGLNHREAGDTVNVFVDTNS